MALVVDALRGFVAARDRLLEIWAPSTDEVPERGAVVTRLRSERAHAQALLIGLADTWPEIVEVVTTKAVVRVVLVRARKEVGAALRDGRIDEATAHRLEAELDAAVRRLFADPPRPRPRAPQQWLAGHPWLAEVSTEVVDALVAHGELVVCEPCFLTSGTVERATGERLVGPAWAPEGLSGRTSDEVRILRLPPV